MSESSNKNPQYLKSTKQNAYYKQKIVEAVGKIENAAILNYIYIIVLDIESEYSN